MNLIDDYVKINKQYLDAPEVFIKAAAYHNVSALLGRFFRSTNIRGGGDAKPNLWIILSSIPGRTRRSTVAKYATYVYEKSLMHFFMDTFNLEKLKAMEKAQSTIIEEGTPEGIVDHVRETKMKAFALMSTEFGSVLTRMNTKESQMGVSTVLSKMYYGEGGSMMLSSRNKDNPNRIRILPKGLYVTMFAGMQEPSLYITPDMARQGLLRRLILCYCEHKDISMENWKAPLTYDCDNIFSELYDLSEIFVHRMKQYRDWASSVQSNVLLLDINFMPDAMKLVNKYAYDDDYDVTGEDSLYTIYKQSYWEHLTKLSMCRSIARDGVKTIRGEHVAIVTIDDVNNAESFLNEATKHSREIVTNLGRKDEPLRSSRDPLDRIYQLIKGAGDKGIKRSVLYRKVNMKKCDLEPLLTTLETQERITTVLPDSSGGRMPVVYKVRKGGE